MSGTIFVAGATGKTGTPLVKLLLKTRKQVRVLTRDLSKASELQSLGAEVVQGDLASPESYQSQLDGVDGCFLAVSNSSQQVDLTKKFIDAAKGSGVGLVVKMSSQGASADVPANIPPKWNGLGDQYLQQSGLNYVILRPNFFAETLDLFLKLENMGNSPPKAVKTLSLPFGANNKFGVVSVQDVAKVAGVCLLDPEKYQNQILMVTGIEAVSMYDWAAIASEVAGYSIQYKLVSMEEYKARLQSSPLPQDIVASLAEYFGKIVQGEFAYEQTFPTVFEVTGSPPISVREHLLQVKDKVLT